MSLFKRILQGRTFRASVCGALCAAAGIAQAQEAPSEPARDPEIMTEVVVTGSRIPQTNLISTSPIQVISAQELKQQGTTDVIDLMNNLPQNFQNSVVDFSNTTNALSTPGGLTTADLRGLGPQRTLVLVDGHRLGSADANTANPNPSPDLDQIPVPLIERIDVVTGGASAVYGSDAVAGVVNFIMRRNFEGLEFDAQFGVNQHDNRSAVQGLAGDGGFDVIKGNRYDGRTRQFSIVAGTNLADGKGNVTAYVTYRNAQPITGSDRDFASCQLNLDTSSQSPFCTGSLNSNLFNPNGSPDAFSVVGDQFVPLGSAASNPPTFFNSNKYIYMSRQDERYLAGFMAHIDVSSAVVPYFEFSFMNDRTDSLVAPSGLFLGRNPLGRNGKYDINCSNPLLSAQQRAILCTPAQVAADALNPGADLANSANVDIGRRNVEGVGRHAFFDHTNYRAVGGVKGAPRNGWTYDAYGQYYYTTLFNSNSGYLDYSAIGKALQVTTDAVSGAPACISGSPCVPYNIFTEGAVTPEQVAFLETPGTAHGTVTQKTVHADVTVDLGVYAIKSPLAADGLGVNFGLEHRSEFLDFAPDAAELAGNLAGFSGASTAVNDGYSVSEEFIEIRVPLISERAGVRDLLFDTGYRHSKYSTAGNTDTYKFELQYAPVDDLRLRASYNKAVRAPNIIELFNPQGVGLQSFVGVDPCAPTRDQSGNLVPATASLEQCMHTGVTAAQFGNGSTTSTISQCIAGQCGQATGGNPNLSPETADTYSVGLTLTPSALPNFGGSIDYYHVHLKDVIGVAPGAFAFQNCLTTGDPTSCALIVRTAGGSLSGPTVASGGYILQTGVNIGDSKLSGIDVQGNYRWTLPGKWGGLSAALNGAWLQESSTTPAPGLPNYDCVGLFGKTCQTLNPKWRHTLRLSWEAPFDTVLSLQWRYIGSIKLDSNDPDPSLNNGVFDAFNARLPTMSYLDLSAIWRIREGISLRAGIDNILDKDPPIITTEVSGTGGPNTYPTYDILGRQAFMGVTAKF